LIYGTAFGFFSSSGLRQGDPLSPILFIVVMETLSILVNKAILGSFFDGFHMSNFQSEGLLIFHLLFADNTTLKVL